VLKNYRVGQKLHNHFFHSANGYGEIVKVKMMLPELEIVRYGNFHGSELESDSEWDGNENDREWKWDTLHGSGTKWKSMTHSHKPLSYIYGRLRHHV